MPSTYQRSLIKGVCWEIVSFIVTAFAVFLWYGDLAISIKFSFFLSLAKIFLFFIHERLWKKVVWGKI